MLLTGADMPQESSIIAKIASTTTSYSSDTLTATTKSRTPGEPHGERMDSSDWHLETHAASATTFLHGSTD
jgi:hypothetical protein